MELYPGNDADCHCTCFGVQRLSERLTQVGVSRTPYKCNAEGHSVCSWPSTEMQLDRLLPEHQAALGLLRV